ncbi:copper amine oxidase [Nonomuraea roseoviolacea]|uniref:Amine oxidase n=1 Tax=Nonomuraea roseoviolacea subsp. carminata TaxID=160689 RepID=A0ABT1K429_9ACTN|nr:copper amine oxidase [Nonomuraea roseoviolacea]MCP2348755.1 primary-amine oxidase [Nonomuraea roseoviolacea subsp. carminata]
MFLRIALAAFVIAAAHATPAPRATLAAASGARPAAPAGNAAPAGSVRTAPTGGAAACGSPYLVDQALPNGARWRMCWEMRTIEGLTLNHVVYTPRGGAPQNVLRSAALAQIHVPYDSGEPRYHDLGSLGESAIALTAADCPGGERRGTYVCVTTRARGHAHLKDGFGDEEARRSRQGEELVVLSGYQVGWYAYVAEWVFGDDGSITPRLGATGSLAGTVTTPGHGWPIGVGRRHFEESHSHNVFWRLDFDVDAATRDAVEQYDFAGTGTKRRFMVRTRFATETRAVNRRMRWWRVLDPRALNADRHPISWEIDNSDSAEYRGPADEAFTRADLYVTQYHACERLATQNPLPRCRNSVDRYVSGERLTDPVVWVNVDFHHVARDEDADPMPVHWQGFRVLPRDVTAKNPSP